MSESLFTSQTPSGTNNSDGGAAGIVLGTKLVFAVDGTVSGIRFYSTTTVGGTYTVGLWSVTSQAAGSLLASKTMGAPPSSGGWNVVSFDTPVSVTADTLYLAGVWNSEGRYVNTASFFGSDVVNGNITGIADGSTIPPAGTLRNGNFEANSAFAYPTDFFNASCYFVDVVFDIEDTNVDGDVALATTFTSAGAASVDRQGAASVATTISVATTGEVQPGAPASLAASFTIAAAGTVTHVGNASLGLTFGLAAETDAPAPIAQQGNWNSILSILNFNADQARLERERPPVDCPAHGWPLEAGRRPGTWHCPYGGDLWDDHSQPIFE